MQRIHNENFLVALFLFVVFAFCACTNSKSNKKIIPHKVELKKEVPPVDSKGIEKKADEEIKIEPHTEKEVTTEPPLTAKQLAFGKGLEEKHLNNISTIDAKKVFRNYCANCHGIKGNLQLNGAKDLTKIQSELSSKIAQVYYGRGLMTPFKDVLKEEEIVAVSLFVQNMSK